jgi:hypothetical protein
MNKLQIGIPVSIGIIITIIIVAVLLNPVQKVMEVEDLMNKEITIEENMLSEVQKKYNEIKKNSLEESYKAEDREWITSGPFQIDRTQYLLGEKVFLRLGGIQPEEKGQVVFMRPLNDTHYSEYITIPFDGMNKGGFNYYFQPKLLQSKGTCSVDDILGEWTVMFRGTQYTNLNFKVINQTLLKHENEFEPIC